MCETLLEHKAVRIDPYSRLHVLQAISQEVILLSWWNVFS